MSLVESVGKKAAFLREVVEQLRLEDVEVIAERAETAARNPIHRDAYDWATARALGTLPVVVELCAPFLGPAGCSWRSAAATSNMTCWPRHPPSRR